MRHNLREGEAIEIAGLAVSVVTVSGGRVILESQLVESIDVRKRTAPLGGKIRRKAPPMPDGLALTPPEAGINCGS